MANRVYYNKNVLRSVKYWDKLTNAVAVNDVMHINSGGSAGIDLTNDYFNGLKSSDSRKIGIRVGCIVEDGFNYSNYIECNIKGTYTDSDGNTQRFIKKINVTKLSSAYSGGVAECVSELDFPPYDLSTCGVSIKNNTNSAIDLIDCTMLRSVDVSSSQVSESISFGVTVRKFEAYNDGIKVYYDGVEEPLKLARVDDEHGNFIGIEVNDEKFISFERIQEDIG